MLVAAYARCSNLGHAAVNEQLGTVYEARVARRQEQDRLGHLLWSADAAQRDQRRHLRRERLDLLARQSRSFIPAGPDPPPTPPAHPHFSSPHIDRPAAR